ncbi:chromate transporter [Mycoplasmopsis ciconiae]|uniref:Chromate transporter n=1 Tax=Mycoplasmopsis ciconiae TaxID=561067 RepID=A0ABU7MLR3_9BACT|nr:chromate transporter [Mycoplasmopsis ciconiae]
MILAVLFLFLSLALISVTVFGGGQVFIPMFQWLWSTINNNFGINISESEINQILTLTNSTPGVISLKFAFISGYLMAPNSFVGYLLAIIAYILFSTPAIIIMIWAMKRINKNQNKYISNLLNILKPVIAAIMIGLSIQLLILILFPHFSFNSSKGYIFYDFENSKNLFFDGWRRIVLYIYVPACVIISFILYKKKIAIFKLIISNALISTLIFAPFI